MSNEMRKFATGATRNTLEGKLSFMRALSPAVLERYAQYLAAHRRQADGSLRAFDDWKKGIPQDAYCDSLTRHAMDAQKAFFNLPTSEGAGLEDLLCAIIFNAQGWLFELLVAKSGNREVVAEQAKPSGECVASTAPVLPAPIPIVAIPKPASKPVHTCGECKKFGDNTACGVMWQDTPVCSIFDKKREAVCGDCINFFDAGFSDNDGTRDHCILLCRFSRSAAHRVNGCTDYMPWKGAR